MNCPALQFLILTVAGWLSRHQTAVTEYLVLIVIDLETRRVAIAGIVHQPEGR